MGVPFPAPALFSVRACVCMCVFLFPDSVLSLLQYNLSCCFSSVASVLWSTWRFKLKWREKCEIVFHKIAPGALRSDYMSGKMNQVLPSFPYTKPISAQHRDSVCSVRWQPGLRHRHHSWMFNQYDLFPSFIPHFFCTSPLFPYLHWKKETYVPVQRETH